MIQLPKRIGNGDLRDRLWAGVFFGALLGIGFFAIAAAYGVIVFWRGDLPSLGGFLIAQLGWVGVYVVGGGVVGALWPLRRSASGRWGLWLVAGAVAAGSLISIREGPFWRWTGTTWTWLLVTAPLFAWVIGGSQSSGRGRSR